MFLKASQPRILPKYQSSEMGTIKTIQTFKASENWSFLFLGNHLMYFSSK